MESIGSSGSLEFFTVRKNIGYWDFGDGCFICSSHKKINIFHRTILRWFFGIKWKDGDPNDS